MNKGKRWSVCWLSIPTRNPRMRASRDAVIRCYARNQASAGAHLLRREEKTMRTTPDQLRAMKQRGERIPMLTAYDYSMASILDAAGVPLLLVGDTLGMVVLGYDSTRSEE